MVFFPQLRFRGVFKAQWSGGLAAGSTRADAILHALLERVEHDAWAMWQLNRATCPRLELDTVGDGQLQDWLDIVRRAGLSVDVRDRRTDIGIPVFRAWLVARDCPQLYAVRGDGCHLDPTIALARALTEAQHKLAFASPDEWQRLRHVRSADVMRDPRSLYFVSGLTSWEMDEGAKTVPFGAFANLSSGAVSADIASAVSLIADGVPGSDVVVVDVTSPHLDVPVVRVLTVGLQEMAKPWTYVLPRTFRVPLELGRLPTVRDYSSMYLGDFPP
jgi:ribosomal protein S12 methylthiotransferase accessory factor